MREERQRPRAAWISTPSIRVQTPLRTRTQTPLSTRPLPQLVRTRRIHRARQSPSCSSGAPAPSPPPAAEAAASTRGLNGTAPLYGLLVLAQCIPFAFAGHGGFAGDVAYFTTTAVCAMLIGCLRGPLEPASLSAPVTGRQAALAPFAASTFLFGSYLLLKYTHVDIGLVFNGLTTFAGGLCVKEALEPVVYSALALVGLEGVLLWEGEARGEAAGKGEDETAAGGSGDGELVEETEAPHVSLVAALASVIALGATAGYLTHLEPTFVFSNFIALGIISRVLSLVKADSFLVAAGLLTGLFCYDIFWVFGSEVMVSVATQIDSPGKLLFPREVAAGAAPLKYPYAILGLGDVCVPGIFASIALAMDGRIVQGLRGDATRRVTAGPYFASAVAAYTAGLLACFGVNMATGAAQPALLYLVPACVGSALAVAGVRGELPQVLRFRIDDAADPAATPVPPEVEAGARADRRR